MWALKDYFSCIMIHHIPESFCKPNLPLCSYGYIQCLQFLNNKNSSSSILEITVPFCKNTLCTPLLEKSLVPKVLWEMNEAYDLELEDTVQVVPTSFMIKNMLLLQVTSHRVVKDTAHIWHVNCCESYKKWSLLAAISHLRWDYQTTLPASWDICMQVKK